MKSSWILGVCLGGLALAGAHLLADSSSTNRPVATGYIERFEVPERDAAGNLRWKLIGERAEIQTDGMFQVTNLRAEFYQSNQVGMVFSSPLCTLDQGRRSARTDGPVRFEAPNIVVTGTGADWTGQSNTFLVRSNVHVVISGSRPAKMKPRSGLTNDVPNNLPVEDATHE